MFECRTFFVWVYTSQDFEQNQPNMAQSHDCMTVTFISSGINVINAGELRGKAQNKGVEREKLPDSDK